MSQTFQKACCNYNHGSVFLDTPENVKGLVVQLMERYIARAYPQLDGSLILVSFYSSHCGLGFAGGRHNSNFENKAGHIRKQARAFECTIQK